VAALLAIPVAGALQVIASEVWQETATPQPESPEEAQLAEQEELNEDPERVRPEGQVELGSRSGSRSGD
jgi:hypothetical protein